MPEYLSSTIQELTYVTPSAYVGYLGSRFQPAGIDQLFEAHMEFMILVVNLHVNRDNIMTYSDGFHGLLAAVYNAVTMKDFGLDMQPMIPISEQAVAGNEIIGVFSIIFKTIARIK